MRPSLRLVPAVSGTVAVAADAATAAGAAANVHEFAWGIAAGFVGAVVIASLIGIFYARRLRDALERLREAMTRAAAGDRGVRLGADGCRLARPVAAAFDALAERMERRLAVAEASAEVDRAVARRDDVARVAGLALRRIPTVVGCDAAAVAVLPEFDASGVGRLYSYVPVGTDGPVARIDLPAADFAEITHLDVERGLDERPALCALASPLLRAGCSSATFFPIDWNQRRCGALVVARRSAAPAEGEREALRTLAGRIGHALAGVPRGAAVLETGCFDPMTALPTPMLFRDRLDTELRRAQRERGEIGVLVVEIDRTDEPAISGTAAAEKILKRVGERLRACLRVSDSIARLNGHAFAMMLPELASAHDAARVAENVVRALEQTQRVDGAELNLSPSVGIALYPLDGRDACDLVRSAEIAAARAKAPGRARVLFYDERMNRETVERSRVQSELRLALERGELLLHLQAQIDLATDDVVSAEVLLRWRHPERGTILPRELIPAAERSGLIGRIGYWVVDEVGRLIDAWREQGVEAPRMMVNLAAAQLRDPTFADALRFAMQRWNVEHGRIGFEIAESTLLDDADTVSRWLSQLRSLGAVVSIEDFGIRRSSLSLLARLPYDLVKINRTFVRDIARDVESASLVRAIVSIAHQFGKQVIGEGIEADTQREFLRHHGCDLGQGVLMGRPLPVDEFLSYLVSKRLLKSSAERAKRLVAR